MIFVIFVKQTKVFYKKNDTKAAMTTLKLKYKAIKVKHENKVIEFSLQGRVESDSNIDIYSESSGKVSQVLVSKSEYVKKYQKIIKIDDILSNLPEHSYSDLPEIHSDIDSSYEQSFKNADKKAKRSLTERYAISPCDGYIKDIFTENGASIFVTSFSATKVASVACSSKIIVKTSASTQNARKISKGMSAKISSDDFTSDGKVSHVAKVLNNGGSVDIEISIPQKDKTKFFIDENVSIKLISKPKQLIKVPLNAVLLDKNGESFVYIIEKNTVKRIKIDILSSDSSYFYTNSLKNDDIVVVSALNFIKIGENIEYEIPS